MNDFLIQFHRRGETRPTDSQHLAALLRDRPVVSSHRVLTFEFPWGSVAIQPPAARGYAPLHDPEAATLVACVGRPRFMGVEHESRGPAGFNATFAEMLQSQGAKAVSDALSGMFAAIECSATGVRLLTDQMGFLPVYVGEDLTGTVVAVGTHLESVAELSGRKSDFDTVSLGDLLVSQYVTFPYTTRRGVTQIGPASLAEFDFRRGGGLRAADVKSTVLWQPHEPAVHAARADELDDRLEAALRAASADMARGVSRIALTLSGGLDSRLVLASLLGDKLAGAITYATRENRELDVARRVAQAAGVRHHVAWRCEEFYSELMPRAVALLGSELRGESHGFCIVDNGLDDSFDVIIGGFLSDTLFKGHYMSQDARERVRRRSPYYRARKAVAGAARAVGLLPKTNRRPHYWEVARNMAARLRPEVREELEDRHRVRLEAVRRVRPESAEEWLRFWPGSRCDGGYGPQANTRLFTADELFMHRRLIEVAAVLPAHEKLNGRLTKRVFPRLYGTLGEIEDSSTGIPAGALAQPLRGSNGKATHRPGDRERAPTAAPPSRYPWNDVQHSWVDYELLQKQSPVWSTYRQQLARSPALEVMDAVLEGGVREYIEAYRDEAGFLFNRAAVQATYALDRSLRPAHATSERERAAVAGCA